MALPADYLQYPRRTRGMDHDRYEWSILFRRPRVEWPGGARVALWVVPSIEWFPLDMPATPFRPPGAMERPYPDYWNYTHRDYGNRVGVFRVMQALDRAGLPREEEAAIVREAVATVRRITGQPVRGWLSPANSASLHTLDLVAAEGVEYVCDWVNDDLPYPMRVAAGRLHSMPYSHEISDTTIIWQGHHTAAEFAEQVRDQFDGLYREAARHGGRILAVSLHPWIIGQPHRIGALEDALGYVMGRAGVWPATGSEILDAFTAQQR